MNKNLLMKQNNELFSRIQLLKKQNVALWLAALGTFVLTTLVCEVGFLANAFGFTAIGWDEYGIAIGLGFCIVPIVEIVKLCQRIYARKKAQK